MIPTGPSPCTKGTRFSSSSANMSSGSEKASVFPDPVKAIPIMSRPVKLQFWHQRVRRKEKNDGAHATGSPCSWMGVGERIFLLLRWSRRGFGSFMSCERWLHQLKPYIARVARTHSEISNRWRDVVSRDEDVELLPNLVVLRLRSFAYVRRSSPAARLRHQLLLHSAERTPRTHEVVNRSVYTIPFASSPAPASVFCPADCAARIFSSSSLLRSASVLSASVRSSSTARPSCSLRAP